MLAFIRIVGASVRSVDVSFKIEWKCFQTARLSCVFRSVRINSFMWRREMQNITPGAAWVAVILYVYQTVCDYPLFDNVSEYRQYFQYASV